MLTVPATIENARKVFRLGVKHGLNIDPAIKELLASLRVPCQIEGFNFTLKPYQAEGVAWLESQLGTGLLADEQGTGKTVQVMAYAHRNHKFPMLIVCPNTLKLNWRNEIIAMTGDLYRINIVGKTYSKRQLDRRAKRHPNVIYSKEPADGCHIYIINYDILAANLERIESMNMRFMAVDESHKIKNQDARRTQAYTRLATGMIDEKKPGGRYETRKIGPGIQSVVLMSGTPMVNRPRELWTAVRSIGGWVPRFSTWSHFAFRYCAPEHTAHGWNFSGASNVAELHSLLSDNIMLRRLKKDVLKDLPPKIYRTIPLDFDRREYDSVEMAFNGINWKAGMETIIMMGGNAPKSDEAIVAIQKLREIAAYAKIKSAIEWIKDYTEEGEKLVVFAHNRLVIDTIRSALEQDKEYEGTVGAIYGGVKDEERADAVQAFQEDPSMRVMLVGITAGGFGLTLTAARAVAFVQLPWTPGEISQCVDRIHRIGQAADSVDVFNLVAEGTIEEEMADMLISKGRVLDAVLDNGTKVNQLDLRV